MLKHTTHECQSSTRPLAERLKIEKLKIAVRSDNLIVQAQKQR